MNTTEEQEYQVLLDKRDMGTLTNIEYKRYLVLLDKVFAESIPKIAKKWTDGFNLT